MTDCFNCYLNDLSKDILDHTEGQLHACLKKSSKRAFERELECIKLRSMGIEPI